jgi:hypothetical protein
MNNPEYEIGFQRCDLQGQFMFTHMSYPLSLNLFLQTIKLF